MNCALIIFATLLLAACCRADARYNPTTDPALDVQFTMASDPHVMADEPIVLRYLIRSIHRNDTIVTKPEEYPCPWYTLEMIDSHGLKVATRLKERPVPTGGPYVPATFMFREGSIREGLIVVNQSFQAYTKGKYSILVYVCLQYADLGPGNQIPPHVNLIDYIDARETAIRRDIPFEVTVRDDNQENLVAAADAFRERYTGADTERDRKYDLESLIALAPRYANNSWRRLGREATSANKMEVAYAFEDNRSLEAIDDLLDMQGTQPPRLSNPFNVTPLLLVERIYRYVSDERKAQIDKLLKRHKMVLNLADISD